LVLVAMAHPPLVWARKARVNRLSAPRKSAGEPPIDCVPERDRLQST
jgi:hypothetical protein